MRSKGGFLFSLFPKISAFTASERIGLICAWLLVSKSWLPPTCLAKAFFAVTWKAGLTHCFGWKILFLPPCPQLTPPAPPVVAGSCFPSLCTTWSHRLLGQERAGGLGGFFSLQHSQLCLLEELARSCTQGGEISISRWQINIFTWQIKAAQLLSSGHELSSLKSEGKIPCICTQESMPRSPGRRKVVEPTQNKESFRATVVACIHSTLGRVLWGPFDITVLQMLKKGCQACL